MIFWGFSGIVTPTPSGANGGDAIDAATVRELPTEAMFRGVKRLKPRRSVAGVLILGFDCEYESDDPSKIVSYQLSDGTNKLLVAARQDFTMPQLAAWVMRTARSWGYGLRNYTTIALISHFSTAELSHIKDFHLDATVRRVSPQQVYNASYRISHRHNLQIIDQYHFWNTSLAKVAQTWGEEKLEYDTTNVTRQSLKDPKFVEYALWDAVVCQRTFTKFRDRVIKEYGLDIIQYPTPASLAMAVWRLHHLGEDLEAPIPLVRRQGWLSLWGGRAEAYVTGVMPGDYTLRDVKSLYPNAARRLRKLPRARDWVGRKEPKSWQGFCKVRFEFPRKVRYPCLPVNHDGRLIFPRTGTANCTLDEAYEAKRLGADLKFLKVLEYEDGDDSFAEFMDERMRKKDAYEAADDRAGRDLEKLLANSSIGKLSQNRGDVDIEDLKEFAKQIGQPLSVVMSPSFRYPGKPEGKHRIGGNIMPEWSALILGRARAIMARLLNDSASLLCSTDSLLVSSEQNIVVDRTMKELGVVLDNKNEHCCRCCACPKCSAVCDGSCKNAACANPCHGKCKRPSFTDSISIVRNRVYAAVCKHDEITFGANHAIHLKRKDALRLILSGGSKYDVKRRQGLKSAIRSGKRFFEESKRIPMAFSRDWDRKRCLLEDGSTRPWDSLREYDANNAKQTPKKPHRIVILARDD